MKINNQSIRSNIGQLETCLWHESPELIDSYVKTINSIEAYGISGPLAELLASIISKQRYYCG